MITFFSEEIDFFSKDEEKITNWIKSCIYKEEFEDGDLSVVFCNDNYLLDINKKYLDHNYYTDIITFDYTEGNIISGDLFISIDRVIENSQKFKNKFENELIRVIIHGILHLLGYGDKTDSEKLVMRKKEDEYLKLFESVE